MELGGIELEIELEIARLIGIEISLYQVPGLQGASARAAPQNRPAPLTMPFSCNQPSLWVCSQSAAQSLSGCPEHLGAIFDC